MRDAMEAASSRDISANKAADMYGVPRSTLKDRLSGRVVHGVKPGPRPYLRESEERELVDHLKELAEIGLGKTRGEVLRIAESVAESKGILKGVEITNGWWRRFLERNPRMTLRAGDPTAGVRLDTVNDKKQYQLVTQHREFQVLRYPLNQKPLLLQICPIESVPLILRAAVVSRAQAAVLFRSLLDLFRREHHQDPQLPRALELEC